MNILKYFSKEKKISPQEKVYYNDDLWRKILSYNMCPNCNNYIEKKEIFNIFSYMWYKIQVNFMFKDISDPIILDGQPKIYKEVYKTNFEWCYVLKLGIFRWPPEVLAQMYLNEPAQVFLPYKKIYCDDCSPMKKINKGIKMLKEKKRIEEEYRKRRRNSKRRS